MLCLASRVVTFARATFGFLSNLDKSRAGEALGLNCLLDVFGDDQGHTPAPGAEDAGVPHLRWVDAQARDGAVLADLLRFFIFGHPVLDLSAPSVINAADDAQCVEDVPRTRMALHLSGDELHSLYVQGFIEPDEAFMDHGNAEGSPTEVQRTSRDVERKSRDASQLKSRSFLELPGINLFAAFVQRRAEMPSVQGAPVIQQLIVVRHVFRVLGGLQDFVASR
jgi:hypothetical protein